MKGNKSMNNNPLVSIITVCYNSEKYIEDTILSVMKQSYKNLQYIIVDGLSTDRTMEIVNKYKTIYNNSIQAISEKDAGIYDAMNKGIELAGGDIIGILNSDDYYVDENVIQRVVDEFLISQYDCVYGDLDFVDANNKEKIVRVWKTSKGDFKKGWNPPHPTSFITKSAYKKFGLYKKDYKISSDYDLLYRMIEIGGISHSHIPQKLVHMRVGGASTRGIKSNIIASFEIYKTLVENKQKWTLFIIIRRLLAKINQFN